MSLPSLTAALARVRTRVPRQSLDQPEGDARALPVSGGTH